MVRDQRHAPAALYPPGKARYPLYRRLGGPRRRFGRAENLAPPGFDPRTVQPVAIRYTDYATRPIIKYVFSRNLYQSLCSVSGLRRLEGTVVHFQGP